MNEILAQVIAGLTAIGATVAVKMVEHHLKQRMGDREKVARPRLVERQSDVDSADGMGEAR